MPKPLRDRARFPEVLRVTISLATGDTDRVRRAIDAEGLSASTYLRRLVVADLNRRDATVAKPRASSGRR